MFGVGVRLYIFEDPGVVVWRLYAYIVLYLQVSVFVSGAQLELGRVWNLLPVRSKELKPDTMCKRAGIRRRTGRPS